jgi:hypothetical protein
MRTCLQDEQVDWLQTAVQTMLIPISIDRLKAT